MKLTLLLLLILAPALARADDVLFFDMNASGHEIEAATAAAKKSKRGLVVFPPLTNEERRQFFELSKAEEAAMLKAQKVCERNNWAADACRSAQSFTKEVTQKLAAIKKKASYKEEDLKRFLKDQKAAGKSFSTVVVSGHNGTGSISGALGSVSDELLASAFDEAGLKDDIRSLHLWGCYTTSPGSVLMNWKPKFPNVNFISGYDLQAPLNDKPAGWQYLKSVIEREPELHRIADAKKLQAALRKLPGALQVNAAITNCGLYANPREAYDFEDYKEQCRKYKTDLEKRAPQFECYLQATSDACADTPVNTNAGVIREYYGILQKTDPCQEISPDVTFGSHNRDQALRLLFNRAVMGNFARMHGQVLNETDEILAAMGAPKELRFADIDKLSRKEALARIDQLLVFARVHLPDLSLEPEKFEIKDETTARAAVLLRTHGALTKIAAQLNPRCVPYSWHESGSVDSSNCLDKEDVGAVGLAFATANPVVMRHRMLAERSNEIEESAGQKDLDPYERLVLSARAERVSNAKDRKAGQGPAKLDQLRNAWAEKMASLHKSGEAKPLENPEARRLQYEYLVETFRPEEDGDRERSGEENDGGEAPRDDPEQIMAEAARIHIELLEPNLKAEEKTKLEEKLAERRSLGEELLVADKIKRLKRELKSSENGLAKYRHQDPSPRRLEAMERMVAKRRAVIERLVGNRSLAGAKLWEERFNRTPLDLPPEIKPATPNEE